MLMTMKRESYIKRSVLLKTKTGDLKSKAMNPGLSQGSHPWTLAAFDAKHDLFYYIFATLAIRRGEPGPQLCAKVQSKLASAQHLLQAIRTFDFTLDDDDVAALDAFEVTPRETYSFTCDCLSANTCSEKGFNWPTEVTPWL